MKRRYIAVKIDCDLKFNEKEFFDAVLDNILKLFGEYGASKTGLTLIEYDSLSKQAILRCSHEVLDWVKAAIVAMTAIGNVRISVHILSISGTLRALRRKIKYY